MLWGKLKMNSARDHRMRAETGNKRSEDICTNSRTPDTVRASFGHVSRSRSGERAAAGGSGLTARRCPGLSVAQPPAPPRAPPALPARPGGSAPPAPRPAGFAPARSAGAVRVGAPAAGK